VTQNLYVLFKSRNNVIVLSNETYVLSKEPYTLPKNRYNVPRPMLSPKPNTRMSHVTYRIESWHTHTHKYTRKCTETRTHTQEPAWEGREKKQPKIFDRRFHLLRIVFTTWQTIRRCINTNLDNTTSKIYKPSKPRLSSRGVYSWSRVPTSQIQSMQITWSIFD